MITLTATIASGNSKSHALYIGKRSVIGVHLPSPSDDSAVVSFEVSNDNSNWRPLQDSAGLIVLPVDPQFATVPEELTRPWLYVRLVSGEPDHLVTQSSDVAYYVTLT
jgi:hypothetical protein